MALGQAVAGPLVIDDMNLVKTMSQEIGAFADAKQATKGSDLVEAMKTAPTSVAVELPTHLPPATTYEDQAQSVFVISSVYKCGKCDKWHLRGGATAWCLTADGVMVTNCHVFEKAAGDSWGVCSVDGKVYRVTQILASDKAADVALFQVDGSGLTPLMLAESAPVGTAVGIISHPSGRHFLHTAGEVARYSKVRCRDAADETVWMSVTAEYAKGSSGGPVMNTAGRVVGMVSNTQSITYGPTGKNGKPTGPHQMVIRNCVPATAIRALTKAPAKTVSVP